MKRHPALLIFCVAVAAVFVALFFAPVKPVLLWTDALVYLLIATLVGFFTYVRSKEHLLAPWRHVVRRPLAMIALVVLSAYVFIGLLDSVHFRKALAPQAQSKEVHYSVEVLSVLDVLFDPIRRRVEKSYSAPLATHLYTKDMVEQADGTTLRMYPRLQYGGRHLQDPESQHATDIFQRAFNAIVVGLVLWMAITSLWVVMLARRHHLRHQVFMKQVIAGKTELPWRAIFITLGVLIVLAMMIVELGVVYHLLGTDKVGNDVLYLSIKSIRTGLVIGTLTTLIMLPFAVMLGIMAGHFRGWVDDVIQYIYTTLNSIPGVLLIAAAILSVDLYISNNQEMFETVVERADIRLLFLCMILGITSWTGLCRLLRGETLKLRELDYIQAASAFGVGNLKIISRHILPNVMHIVLIAVVLDFSGLVLAEAVLSYVGVGVDPSMASWGNMINSARLEMAREPVVWWSLVSAFWFMFLLVLAANIFSDAVRDAFDPRVGRSNR
jgi:peptide/nickel transport system permease protein